MPCVTLVGLSIFTGAGLGCMHSCCHLACTHCTHYCRLLYRNFFLFTEMVFFFQPGSAVGFAAEHDALGMVRHYPNQHPPPMKSADAGGFFQCCDSPTRLRSQGRAYGHVCGHRTSRDYGYDRLRVIASAPLIWALASRAAAGTAERTFGIRGWYWARTPGTRRYRFKIEEKRNGKGGETG
jgi:hypothetical protein